MNIQQTTRPVTSSGTVRRAAAVTLVTLSMVVVQESGVALPGYVELPQAITPRPLTGHDTVQAAPGQLDAGTESVWEAYAGMVAAATTFPCCVDGTCAEMLPGDCASAPGTVVCACLSDVNPENGVDDACEPCAVASTPLPEDSGSCTCSVSTSTDCTKDDDCPQGETCCSGESICIGGACYVPKNRYISFDPNNAGRCVALQVELTAHKRCSISGSGYTCETGTDCPDPPSGQTCVDTDCVGTTWWVDAPVEVEHAGQIYWISRLTDFPVYRNWTEGVIHVGDMQIVPAAEYAVRAIEQDCDLLVPANFSPLLALPTVPKPASRYWGDVVGPMDMQLNWTPPNAVVNMDDVAAVIDGYQANPFSPPLPWVDIARVVPNTAVDGRDILAVTEAFMGNPYPGPSPCGGFKQERRRDPSVTPAAECPPECPLPDPPPPPVVTCTLVDSETGEELPLDGGDKTTTVAGKGVLVEVRLQDMNCVKAYQTDLRIMPDDGGVEMNCPQHAQLSCHEDGVSVQLGRGDFVLKEGHDVGDSYAYCSCTTNMATVRTETHFGCAEEEPLSYLATYMLKINPEAAGQEFGILIHAEEPESVTFPNPAQSGTFLLNGDQNAYTDSTLYTPDPVLCGTLKVAYDCNQSLVADDCEANECNSQGLGDPCETYASCEGKDDCNANAIPDECEIVSAQCPAVPDGPYYCCPDCIGCPEDPAHCICSATQEDCPEGCDCVTGEGCPEGCEPQCVVDVACDPDCQPDGEPGHGIPDACDIANCAGDPDFCDCNNNDVPDKCDIMEDDSGLCLEGSCSWDCKLDGIPDECEPNCSDDDACPDECEGLLDRAYQGCGGGIPEQDCDTDGICNACEIAILGLDERCVTLCEDNAAECGNSSDCQSNQVPDECDINPSDPDGDGWVSPDCQPNVIPDECDITCADNPECTDECSDNLCCKDCNNDDIPDGCNIRDCVDDVACQDWNYNDVPDACDIPEDSCDANENGIPDEGECPGASPDGNCDNAFEDGPAAPTTTIDAAFRIEWLNGSPGEFSGLSGSATIWRGLPHFHDDPEDQGDDQPCLVPPGFPEPQPTDFARSREVHLEITDLDLTGSGASLSLGSPALGETQGTCLDFPADIFFTWYIQATMGTVKLHNETPIVLRGELSNFDWDYWWEYTSSTTGQRRSVFVNDHTTPAIPLFDTSGVHRAYLARTRLGQGQFTEGADESCCLYRGVDGRVSFAVDGYTEGVLIPDCETNHVKEDKDAQLARQRVTVYNAMGDPPPLADFTGTWENSNAVVPALTGNMEAGGFVAGDAINSMSFGRDGTGDVASPILYFSVDGDSTGQGCTDVNRQTPVDGNDRQRIAADVYVVAGKNFGSYDSPLVPPCIPERGNCLVADQTALGLGPLAIDLVDQENRGLQDNIIALEASTFPGDWAYFTFKATDPPLDQTRTTIYVYNPANGSFGRSALAPFVNLGPGEGGLGLLQSNDTIDAIAVSDVGGARQGPNGQWDDGDEVLFSLASGSQTLVDHGWSGAHIFKVTYGQSDPITATNVFLGPAALGLMGGTDDIDAIDVGVSKVFEDCNHNGIDDLCDIARGFSANDIGPLDDVPDECETACTVTSKAPKPERLPLLGDPISQKVRYISFTASDTSFTLTPSVTGQRQAIRVTFEDLPAPFDVFNGEVMWVGEPTIYCENGGKKTPPCPSAQPSDDFLGATLQCQTYFTDWHGVCRCGWCIGGFNDGQTCSNDHDCAHTIHVYHQLIVPEGVYRIDVIDQRCTDLSNQLSYSEPMDKDDLETTTSKWGDMVRDCITDPCSPPDGVINMASDVTAVLDKFRNLDGAPTKARADVEPHIPDQLVNIADATYVLDAFRGFVYPFPAPDLPLCDNGASDW